MEDKKSVVVTKEELIEKMGQVTTEILDSIGKDKDTNDAVFGMLVLFLGGDMSARLIHKLFYEEDKKEDEKVSAEEFAQYVSVQKSGVFNMFDPRAREMTSLSKEKWLYIIQNYSHLCEVYGVEP